MLHHIRRASSFIFAVAILVTGAASTDAQDQQAMFSSMGEMHKLVAANTDTRGYLFCAALSANLDMMDVYGLFVRKAATSTSDANALALAISYMSGFTDSELMHLQGGLNKKQAGEALASLYKVECMKHILPK